MYGGHLKVDIETLDPSVSIYQIVVCRSLSINPLHCFTMIFRLDVEAIQSHCFGMPHQSLMSLSLSLPAQVEAFTCTAYDSGKGGDKVE